jgi:hypothetical protein
MSTPGTVQVNVQANTLDFQVFILMFSVKIMTFAVTWQDFDEFAGHP